MNPAEFLYYLGHKAKTAYDLRRQRKLPVPVISIGNMTTGGTGKTPAAIALALEAKARGLRPCVLTRGYKGSLRGPCIITPGMDASEAGDEPLLMALKLGGEVPVIKCADRYAAGMYAIETLSHGPSLFILDDGFQHRRLCRDLDVVLVSAVSPLRAEKLLPSGRLREPLAGLNRAGVILITNVRRGDAREAADFISLYNRHAPVFEAGHRSVNLVSAPGGTLPLETLAGKRIHAFSGIADPGGFFGDMERAGAVIVRRKVFKDHHAFSPSDIEAISVSAREAGAEWIITTEKDIIRLKGRGRPGLPGNLLALAIELSVGKAFYDFVFERCASGKEG